MDADRLDAIAKSLIAATSRRRTLGGLLGTLLGVRGLLQPDEASARSGKCRPQCAECEKCNKGTCKKTKSGKTRCKPGTCQPKPNGIACTAPSGGVCCGGVCSELKTDEANCGACGAGCAANQVCQEGVCFASGNCPASTTDVCSANPQKCGTGKSGSACFCGRSTEGNVVCITSYGIGCPPHGGGRTCTSKATCLTSEACVDVSGCCGPGVKICLPPCPAPA